MEYLFLLIVILVTALLASLSAKKREKQRLERNWGFQRGFKQKSSHKNFCNCLTIKPPPPLLFKVEAQVNLLYFQ
jgi:hypothetical protein